MSMSDLSLFDTFLNDFDFAGGRRLSALEFLGVVENYLKNAANTDVPGSVATALYSGKIGTVNAYEIAQGMAA